MRPVVVVEEVEDGDADGGEGVAAAAAEAARALRDFGAVWVDSPPLEFSFVFASRVRFVPFVSCVSILLSSAILV